MFHGLFRLFSGLNDHDPRKYKAPAFSFGKRHQDFNSSYSPGPSYLIPSNITKSGRDGNPVYSLYSRPKEIRPFQTPGPGQDSSTYRNSSGTMKRMIDVVRFLYVCRTLPTRKSRKDRIYICARVLAVCQNQTLPERPDTR